MHGYRWEIEVCLRNTKQLAGLGDCQARGFVAHENHATLVMLGYLFLLKQARSNESAGQTLARIAHQPIDLGNVPAGVPQWSALNRYDPHATVRVLRYMG
jgi:hypothetical protein